MKKIIITSIAMIQLITVAFAQNIGIGINTPVNTLDVAGVVTAAGNASIYGNNTGTYGNGILGISNSINTVGVRGTSLNGIGVHGITLSGIGMVGSSLSGIGIDAQCISGYGLISSGKLKISGGNTTPTPGAILTSDAEGNAVWKRSGLAFSANSSSTVISGETNTKIEFTNEAFDTQNNFAVTTGAANAGSSVFTAPVAGVYHFSSTVVIEKTGVSSSTYDIANATIVLKINGSNYTSYTTGSIKHANSIGGLSDYVYLNIDADIKLFANDKIWIEVRKESSSTTVPLNNASYNCRFDGELIYAD